MKSLRNLFFVVALIAIPAFAQELTIHFKEFIPTTLVTSNITKIIEFQANHEIIIVKPLDGIRMESDFSTLRSSTHTRGILKI